MHYNKSNNYITCIILYIILARLTNIITCIYNMYAALTRMFRPVPCSMMSWTALCCALHDALLPG